MKNREIEKKAEIFLDNLLKDLKKIEGTAMELRADTESFCSCFFNLDSYSASLRGYSDYFKEMADALDRIKRDFPRNNQCQ